MDAHDWEQVESSEAAARAVKAGRRGEPADTQRSFMPAADYFGIFVHAAAVTHPCHRVGGDFFDYVDTGWEFHILLGDVCGKGTAAALQAALVQGMLAAELETGAGPATVVAQLNRTLCRRGTGERFVTLFYGVMTRDDRLTYCNAGHCRPMLVTPSEVRRLSVGGLPPGLFAQAQYQEESLEIGAGDTLVVFSDGISEATSRNQQFGDARIQQIVTTHTGGTVSAILERLMSGARDFSHGRQRDEMTVLVARYLA